jgi:hypothetical protein
MVAFILKMISVPSSKLEISVARQPKGAELTDVQQLDCVNEISSYISTYLALLSGPLLSASTLTSRLRVTSSSRSFQAVVNMEAQTPCLRYDAHDIPLTRIPAH